MQDRIRPSVGGRRIGRRDEPTREVADPLASVYDILLGAKRLDDTGGLPRCTGRPCTAWTDGGKRRMAEG